jgi:cytochrome c peroxidase
MNGTRAAIAQLITSDATLRRDYEAVFGPISDNVDRTFANIGKAIAAYQRRLVSRNSPFDRYVAALRAGKPSDALSPQAVRGLQLFIGRGNCRVCHSGPNFTDGEFHNTGVPGQAASDRTDGGRYEGIPLLQANAFNRQSQFSDSRNDASAELLRAVRRTPDTWAQFKTPTLRNVALTAPYMHHGQLATLRDVLAFYSTVAGSVDQGPHGEKILAPLQLSEQETTDLIAFLESLSDEAIDPELLNVTSATAR